MILVTGGTGFIGRHLVKVLVEEGSKVRCLARRLSEQGQFFQGAEFICGDVTDQYTLTKACHGAEVVIHLVAIIREKGGSTFEKVNVQGTRNIVTAAEAAGVRRFIHMGALGTRDDPAYRYAFSKWQGEEIVRKSSLNWTIIKPSLVYGEGFGFFNRLIQSIKMCPPPFVPVPGSGKTRFQPIAVEDLVKCIKILLKNENFTGISCELGGPEQLTYEQMLDILMNTLGVRRVKLHIPILLMRIVVPLMGALLKDPPVTSVELKQMDYNNVAEKDAVEKLFGFKPRRLSEGLGYITESF